MFKLYFKKKFKNVSVPSDRHHFFHIYQLCIYFIIKLLAQTNICNTFIVFLLFSFSWNMYTVPILCKRGKNSSDCCFFLTFVTKMISVPKD